MPRIPLLRGVALAVAAAIALSGVALATTASENGQVVVQQGDTLGSIASKHGLSIAQLAALNGLANPDLIRIGQVLNLVSGGTPAAEADATVVVQPGESLWTISRRYQVRVTDLAQLNGIDDFNLVAVGQKLALPANAVLPATPTAQAAQSTAAAPSIDASAQSNAAVVLPDSPIATALKEAAQRHAVDPALVEALAWHVSRWNPNAGAPDAAHGVMQLTPATQTWVQGALLQAPASGDETKDNIETGATYLGYLLDKFGSEPDALAAYLQGPGSVRRGGPSETTLARVTEILELTARLRAAPGAIPTPAATSATAASATAASAAAPIATPAASTTDAGLQAQLDAFVSQQPKDVKIGLVAYNLTTQDDVWVNGDDVFPAASLLKLGIMATLFEDASTGKIKLTDSMRADLSRMLSVSDNDAANRLMDQVGIDRVNKVLAVYGLTDTKLHNHFAASPDSGEPIENETSASDMEFLVELMASDQLVDKASSAQMRDLLGQSEDDSKLLRPIPADVKVDHKSGWYPGVAHDVGIVYAPRSTYVIAVLTSGSESDDAGNFLIGDLSRLVYRAWGA